MKRKRLLIFSVMAGMIIASHAHAYGGFYDEDEPSVAPNGKEFSFNKDEPTVAPPVSLDLLKGKEIYNYSKKSQWGKFASVFGNVVIKGKKNPPWLLKTISSTLEENRLSKVDYCDQEQEIYLHSTATKGRQTVWETVSLYCLTDQGITLVAKIDDLKIDWENLLKRGMTGTVLGLPKHSSRLKRSHRYPEVVFFGIANWKSFGLGNPPFFSKKNKLKRLSFVENRPLVVDPFGLVLLIKTMKIEKNNLSRKIRMVINRKVEPMLLQITFQKKEGFMHYNPFVVKVSYEGEELVEVKVDGNEGRNLSRIKF
jgi:hypothetical protein